MTKTDLTPNIAVVTVDADAYVAIPDDNGVFLVEGRRCRISNAMPDQPGPSWRSRRMAGGIAYERWRIQTYGRTEPSAIHNEKDLRTFNALKADFYVE